MDARYTTFSRFTDPGPRASMLAGLPDDAVGLCDVARRQTIHHNLLSYFGVASDRWPEMSRVWPPYMPDILTALAERPPRNLSGERAADQRVIGACMLESHFLAGLLRFIGIPARTRAGYFQNIRTNGEHIVRFWEQNLRARRARADLLEVSPTQWLEEVNAESRRLNSIDHHIEHWVCEHWDVDAGAWRVLDANTAFLKAHSDIEVGFHLPEPYFQHAASAWRTMRTASNFDRDQYAEEPQDGRSHIRSQLLWDFYSLLNHDIAGADDHLGAAYGFVKRRRYDDVSNLELAELDALAELLSDEPSIDELVVFYDVSATLRLASAEADRYSFVARAAGA